MGLKGYKLLATTGFVLWAAETAYFGWNVKPASGFEALLDSLTAILIFWGVVGDLLSNVTVHKTYNLDSANLTIDKNTKITTKDITR